VPESLSLTKLWLMQLQTVLQLSVTRMILLLGLLVVITVFNSSLWDLRHLLEAVLTEVLIVLRLLDMKEVGLLPISWVLEC